MEKPTVFFSHSGSDKVPLVRLKELFLAKTGGAIEVFLSSDGQSIPFGRNWVHRVEQAMKGSELMVTFLTPAALSSGWVYFEAGYSYSKGVKVVPVGFLGINLGNVSAPLSLLQGFNITSHDGLNNLIAIANEQFNHTHPESFTPEEFQEIQALGGVGRRAVVGNLVDLVDEISLSVKFEDLKVKKLEFIPTVADVFKAHKAAYSADVDRLLAAGCVARVDTGEDFGFVAKAERFDFELTLDPLNLVSLFPIVLAVLKKVTSKGVVPTWRFKLKPGADVVQKTFKIAARLKDKPV